MPSDLEKIEIAFLVLGTLSTLGVIAMTIYRLTNTIDDSDSTFALVLLVNSGRVLAIITRRSRPLNLKRFETLRFQTKVTKKTGDLRKKSGDTCNHVIMH